jgi:hypothetical protein
VIAVGTGHNNDLMQDVIFNVRVSYDPVNRRVVQEIPWKYTSKKLRKQPILRQNASHYPAGENCSSLLKSKTALLVTSPETVK